VLPEATNGDDALRGVNERWYNEKVIGRRATIAVLAATTVTLAACSGAASISTTGIPSTTVPPKTSTVASTSSSTTSTTLASGVPAVCLISQLRVVRSGFVEAAGSVAQVIAFINVSKTTCALTGYPKVLALESKGAFVGHAGDELQGMLGGLHDGATTPPTVTLKPGQTATATVEGMDHPVRTTLSCPYYFSFLVTPPSETHSIRVLVPGLLRHGFPGCFGILVTPVVPGRTGWLN